MGCCHSPLWSTVACLSPQGVGLQSSNVYERGGLVSLGSFSPPPPPSSPLSTSASAGPQIHRSAGLQVHTGISPNPNPIPWLMCFLAGHKSKQNSGTCDAHPSAVMIVTNCHCYCHCHCHCHCHCYCYCWYWGRLRKSCTTHDGGRVGLHMASLQTQFDACPLNGPLENVPLVRFSDPADWGQGITLVSTPLSALALGGGGGVGTRPRYLIVCLWRRLLASRHCSF